MIFLVLGAVPFLVFSLFDLASLRKTPFLKPLILFLSVSLFVFALTMLNLRTERLLLPAAVSLAGWVLAAMFLGLGLYSFFIEIPFRTTYLRKGYGRILVTTGTYALVRHPAVLWFVLFLASLFLATGSKGLLAALPLWGLLDVVHVAIQEKIYLVRVFGQPYREYQRSVPMLIPNSRSIQRCRQTLFGRRSNQAI